MEDKDKISINADIQSAETLPSQFYTNDQIFESTKESVFGQAWHWVGDVSLLNEKINSYPFILLPDYLDEPLVLTRDQKGEIRCLSNVCTHRANIICHKPNRNRELICGYHGRRFGLNGAFIFMPEFSDALNFPRPCDRLASLNLTQWRSLLFIKLCDKNIDIQPLLNFIDQRIGFMSSDSFVRDDSLSKDYQVDAHWALYCDNFLEGFHIPFVHDGLNEVLDYNQYSTEVCNECILQIGYGSAEDEVFDLPKGHIDYGKNIAAYYFFIFPNIMLNYYPWGLSVNIVEPISKQKTRVKFISYVYDRSKLLVGAGAGLDTVEHEDEEVVQNVQIGIKSRFYNTGRFSPRREQGVHHFHRLLSRAIAT